MNIHRGVCCKHCTHMLPYKCMHAPVTLTWWARGRIGFRSRGCFKVRCFFHVWIVNELDSFRAGCMHVWWMWRWRRAMHFPAVWALRWGQRSNEGGFQFFFSFCQTLPPGRHSDPHAWHVCILLSARIYIWVTSLGAEIITTLVRRHFNALETTIIHVLLSFLVSACRHFVYFDRSGFTETYETSVIFVTWSSMSQRSGLELLV